MAFGADLTLASLTVDTTGSVRNLKAQDQAVVQSEQKMTGLVNASDRVGRALATGLFASGVYVVKNLADWIVRAQVNFGTFDSSVTRAETSLFRLAGRLTGLNDTLRDTSTILDAISRSADSIDGQREGSLWRRLWGTTEIGAVQNILAATAELVRMQDPKYGTGGAPSTAKPWEKIGVLNVPPRPGAKYEPPPPPYAPMAQKLEFPPNLADQVRDYANTVNEADIATRNLAEGLGGSGRNAPGLISIAEHFGEVWAEDVTGTLGETPEQIMKVEAQLTALSSAATAFGEAAAAALFQAGTSFKEAMGKALMGLAQTMTVYALTSLALGALASTPWGAAILGPPSGYFKAAAVFGVAAAAGYATASALGARREGAGGAAGGGGGSALQSPGLSQGAGRPAPNVTINVNGSMLGTSPDQLKRDIVDLWLKGTRDLGGASAVVARG